MVIFWTPCKLVVGGTYHLRDDVRLHTLRPQYPLTGPVAVGCAGPSGIRAGTDD